MDSNKILFLKFGNFSNINSSVYRILEREYPECEIETIDAWELIKHKTSIHHYFLNCYFFLKEYGIEIIRGHKKLNLIFEWFFATSYISILISKKIKKMCKGREYKFSFQTQSLFNGKVNNTQNYIYTDHTTRTNLLYPDINPYQYLRSKRFIEKSEVKAYEDATMVFTFGNLVAHSLDIQYHIPKEKVSTIYVGSNVKKDLGGNNMQKYSFKNILFVGVDWERKGGAILLEVFKKVLDVHPDASLTIVGCSPKNIKLPNCNIVGKIPVESVSKYYNSASIFCLPTLREPFGVAFIEAMSFHLPIVANNIGCVPDLVVNDYNGYLINNNVDHYSAAICKLFDDPVLCQNMGENGYRYIDSKFNWGTVGKMIKKNIVVH